MVPRNTNRAAAGTRVPDGYPGNFLLPAATRVPEQKQIIANVLNISAIFKQNLRNPNIDLSDINSSPMNFMIVSDIFCILGLYLSVS